jgi:hypothetical protein
LVLAPRTIGRDNHVMRFSSIAPALALCGAVAAVSSACGSSDTTTNPFAVELPPPPPGQGFQMATNDISVASGTEEQDCYFYKVSDLLKGAGMDPTKPLNLHHVQVSQRDGSHHMNIFRVRTIVNLDPAKGAIQTGTNGQGECFKSGNWSDWPLIANSQKGGALDWTFPDGVYNPLQPDEWLMLQTHWVNASTQTTPTAYGRVKVNFWDIPAGMTPTDKMGTLFATKQSIRICQSNPTPEFESSCQIKAADPTKPIHIIGANGHFHSRGRTFDMYTWDGTSTTTPDASSMFYSSTDWAEPKMLTSVSQPNPLDVTVQANGGVWYSCSYQWEPPDPTIGCDGLNAADQIKYPALTPDCCYDFGPIVEKNEHCNAFVYYYPASDNVTCF